MSAKSEAYARSEESSSCIAWCLFDIVCVVLGPAGPSCSCFCGRACCWRWEDDKDMAEMTDEVMDVGAEDRADEPVDGEENERSVDLDV